MLMDMRLPKFGIGTGQWLQIVWRATQSLDVPIFFQKKVLPDVLSEIHLVRHKIVSTGQFTQA